ncbi:serine/threonine-protein kinase pakD isoform X2 [Ceratitis capitata]|uniref:serine/threonine-protein kinase pakD isoform X2 n=1 Tax=Ceratitis capitata TaxID=7213 RepID=UPI000A10876E|nr:serine/threonine-protein kinase pakD isoform X2 [Ceratitis capitata]
MAANGEQPTTAHVSHPLQDIDLDVTDDAAAGKQNWVKFDDDEAANKATTTNNNNNNNNNTNNNNNNNNTNNIHTHADIDNNATRISPITVTTNSSSSTTSSRDVLAADTAILPTPANRLSPATLLPAPPSRKQSSVATASIPITTATTAAIARPRSPLNGAESGSGAEVIASAPAPVQRTTITTKPISATTPTAPMPADVAPAVLNTESTHVNLNASGRSQAKLQQQQQQHHTHATTQPSGPLQQHQQQQQQQLHQQKSKLSPSNVGAGAGGGVGVVAGLQQHQQQQHYQNNNGTSPSNGSSHRAPSTATATTTTTLTATSSVSIPVETVPPMRTIELSTGRIREGFANGDVIVTLLPANTKWPWITPAIFRPELVPEELMAQGLTLTVEEYVNAMETLVNDYRFTVYNICYKRILVCWIALAFTVLLTLLFSGLQGVALFSLGVGWLFLNAAAIFLCMWVKLRLSRGLEKCLARVNRQLMKHKILLILDDRGRISCHKVNLCFLYFDATQCVNFLNEFLEHTEQSGGEAIKAGWERKLDIDVNDIVIQGNNPVRLSRKQERGTQLYLRYAARWGMEALRGLVDVTPLEPGRHCGQFQCPCQYIKEHLQCKPRGYPCSCIAYATDPNLQDRF